MEPISSAIAAAQAAAAARRAWKKADDEVAAAAKEQGISKKEAWARIQAEVLRRTGERIFDPGGWGAAARAFDDEDQAKRHSEPDHMQSDQGTDASDVDKG